MLRKKHIVSLGIITVLSISTLSSFANDTNKINNQLENNNTQQEQVNSEIQQNERQQRSIVEEIQRLEVEIERTEEEIREIQRDITNTERQVDLVVEELIEAEENIDSKQDLLGARLNTMYKSGTVGYLEVLLSSRDFTELLTNLDMVKKIVNHDVELLKYLEEQKNLIEEKKIQLENYQRQLINLKNNSERKQQQLVVSRGEQRQLQQELQNDKVELAKQLDQLEKEAKALEDELRKLQSDGDYVGGEMAWPVPGYSRISSPFGNRIHPILRTQRFHSGIDIPAPTGTTIVAATEGRVIAAGSMGGYGRTVILDHGGGITTLYAHNNRLVVSVGDTVSRGQKIAEAGSTGQSTGPHLHFEVRKDGVAEDPIPWVRGR